MNEQDYIIKSYKKGEGVSHSYEIPPCEEVKNIWRTRKIQAENFKKFKTVVRGVQQVIDEIESITSDHEERINKNNNITRLESKLTICLKKEGKK